MVIIFCALNCEAAMLIKHYNLKRIDSRAFSIYVSENEQVMLVVTGVGKIAAANAVGFIAGKYDISDASVINFGTAAGTCDMKTGELLLANKITDMTAGRDFYPDMLIKNDLEEGVVQSVDTIIKAEELIEVKGNENAKVVLDMEASAIYQAAHSYIGPHQMHFLKMVSDNGIEETADFKLLSQKIEELINENGKQITEYIDSVISFTEELQENRCELSEDGQSMFEKMSEALKCSVSMERELYQLFVYKELEGSEIEPYFAEYELRELLPCKSRREGKVILDEIRRNMLK